jgi:hypothetical protein
MRDRRDEPRRMSTRQVVSRARVIREQELPVDETKDPEDEKLLGLGRQYRMLGDERSSQCTVFHDDQTPSIVIGQ